MPTLSLPWMGDMDDKGVVKVWMPKGEYKVNVRSDDNDFAQYSLELKGGKKEALIKGKQNPFRRLRGQPAPDLQVLDAVGVGKDVSLKDYRGKHVLLEFWGYWCKPCVESSLPSLIQYLHETPGLSSKLAILAIHENSSGNRTLEELNRHLPKLQSQYWGGPLPFPLILEKPASLTRTFGIRVYPTAVLIDPDGKIIDRADVNTLRALFGR